MNYIADINLQVIKIYVAAEKLSKIICKKTHIKSDLIFYEEIFYFYFLNNASLCLDNTPGEVTNRIGSNLFAYLEKLNKQLDPKIRLICFKRFKTYINMFLKYDEKFISDFFLETFMYQSELIVYIQENNAFMDPALPPSSSSTWIQKAATNNYYAKINKILNKHSNIILDFITK